MKKLLYLFFFLLTSYTAQGQFNQNNDWSITYNDCDGTLKVTMKIAETDGDDDDMDWFQIGYQDGNVFRILFWYDDQSTGYPTGWTRTYAGEFDDDPHWYAHPAGVTVQSITTERITFTTPHLPSADLGNTSVIKAIGYWEGDGSDPNVNMDVTKTTTTQATIGNPSQLTATANDCNKISLSWTNSNSLSCDNSTQSTLIYKKLASSSYWGSPIATPSFPTNTYDDTDIIEGENYDYRIQHRFLPNSYRYDVSEYVTTNTPGSTIGYPDAPTNFTATTDNCDGTVDLSWQNVNGATRYFVSMLNLSNGSYDEITVDDGNTCTFSGVSPNQNIEYSIKAQNECYRSSDLVYITESIIAPPAAPTDLTVVAGADDSADITWNAVPYATGYKIERTLLGGGGALGIDIVGGNTTYYNDPSIVQCQTYEYRISAINDCSPDGVQGSDVASYVLGPDIDNIFNTQAVNGAESLRASKGFHPDRVELSWSVENNANSINAFKIYRKILGDSGEPTVIDNVNSGTNLYVDYLVDAGVLYEYFIVGESQCENNTLYSLPTRAVGFRSPFGTVTGQVTYGTGTAVKDVRISAERSGDLIFGNSLEFDGSSRLEIPNQANFIPDDALLVEAWIKPDSYTNSFTIIEKLDAYSLGYSSSTNEYLFEIWITPASQSFKVYMPNTEVPLNEFSHIAAQFHQNYLKIFVNGELVSTSDFIDLSDINDESDASLEIGTDYTGILDELRIWNIGKSDEDIAKDYARLMNGGEQGLKVYFRMDEGVGDNAYDISKVGNFQNENHATFIGNPQWSTTIPTASQLSLTAYTNQDGNYQLNIPYNGVGETFVLTPAYGTHEFAPPCARYTLAMVHSFAMKSILKINHPSMCQEQYFTKTQTAP